VVLRGLCAVDHRAEHVVLLDELTHRFRSAGWAMYRSWPRGRNNEVWTRPGGVHDLASLTPVSTRSLSFYFSSPWAMHVI
jgi:hypothetical protein